MTEGSGDASATMSRKSRRGDAGRDPQELARLGAWKKAAMVGQEFDATSFPDALEVVYWLRQVRAGRAVVGR